MVVVQYFLLFLDVFDVLLVDLLIIDRYLATEAISAFLVNVFQIGNVIFWNGPHHSVLFEEFGKLVVGF